MELFFYTYIFNTKIIRIFIIFTTIIIHRIYVQFYYYFMQAILNNIVTLSISN